MSAVPTANMRREATTRLTNCPRCDAYTVSKKGVKGGKPVWLSYNAEGTRLHKFECPMGPWKASAKAEISFSSSSLKS